MIIIDLIKMMMFDDVQTFDEFNLFFGVFEGYLKENLIKKLTIIYFLFIWFVDLIDLVLPYIFFGSHSSLF